MTARVRHPLIILGLDGATFDVLEPLFAHGELPHLRALAHTGLRTELWSTLPPATLPAWTSFLTAATPAEHGVTDLMLRVPGTYGLRPASGRDRQLPTFLARLSAAGLRVAAIGVPGTFPPEHVNGIVVPGFDAPGAARLRPDAVWPPELYDRIRALGGWRFATFNEHGPAEERLASAATRLEADLAAKERVVLTLYQDAPWDVFFVHLQACDTAQHHLWHTHDPRSPRAAHPELKEALTRVFRRVDALVGRLLALAPADGRVLVVSDHGMGGAADVAVHLNRWLAERGLLVFAGSLTSHLSQVAGRVLRRGLAAAPMDWVGAAAQRLPVDLAARLFAVSHHAPIDFGASLAFSDELDYAPSIWLNGRGRFAEGLVEETQVDGILDRLVGDLKELRHPVTRESLVARAYRRRELPGGPYALRAPDLLIEPAWPGGYRPSFLPSRGPGPAVRKLAPEEHDAGKGAGMPGVHKRQGVFMAVGPDLPALELPLLEIHQAGALVYPLLDLPVPADLAAAVPSFAAELMPLSLADSGPKAAAGTPPSPREEAEMLKQLDELGYLG